MALLQLSEPGQSLEPHQKKYAIGIDLGTSNSLVATVQGGTANTIADYAGNELLPSVVHYQSNDNIQVGCQAREAANTDPLNTIFSIKRLMGRTIEDVVRLDEQLPYRLSQTEGRVPLIETNVGKVTPMQVSAEILKVLLARGQDFLANEVEGAVITVPAYFDDTQRQATKDAAQIAGLKVLRLINEPTAAAIAYGLDKDEESAIAVFDLGGGTFDVSVLKLSQGVFEVCSTGGDSALGGDDFDTAIAQWILKQSEWQGELSPLDYRLLMSAARLAKERLSSVEETTINVSGQINWQGQLSQTEFNSLIESMIDRCIKSCKRALRDAKIKVSELDNVILVGGSTRVPLVRNRVAAFFCKQPLADLDPDKVVALGAAVQADILVGNNRDTQMLLLDVIPLSLGVETMGGLVDKIVPRNTTIPVARAQEFTTHKDGQTAMSVHVLQGEREFVKDCRSLAHFELQGIPPKTAGSARVQITYQVDADGLLEVTAKELESGVVSQVQVKPSYGLSDVEISDMLRDSFTSAVEDKNARKLREQQVEVDRLLDSLHAALDQDGDLLLSEQERSQLNQQMSELADMRDSVEAHTLSKAVEKLGLASEEYAARRMNCAIQEALQGRSLNEFDDLDE